MDNLDNKMFLGRCVLYDKGYYFSLCLCGWVCVDFYTTHKIHLDFIYRNIKNYFVQDINGVRYNTNSNIWI